MDEVMQCAVCFSDYDVDSHKPCIGKCGHSICHKCASDERCEACPVCRRGDSFQEVVVSFGMMSIIECINNKKKEEEEKNKDMEGKCTLCKKYVKQLSICIDCNLNNGILKRSYSKSLRGDDIQMEWNTESIPLDECMKQADSSTICADCGTSSVHSEHKIIFFKELLQKLLKQEVEVFLDSFDTIKRQAILKIDEYQKISSNLCEYMRKLTSQQCADYSKQILEFINNSKIISDELLSCHRDFTSSISKFEKKLVVNAQLSDIVNQEKIHSLEEEAFSASIYTYNPITMRMEKEIKIGRLYQGTKIFYKNYVYVIGGYYAGKYLKNTTSYNLNDSSSKELCDLNVGRIGCCTCVHNGNIIACDGGNYQGLVNSVEEYNIERNEWKIIGRLNGLYSNTQLVSLDNNLYVIGESENKRYVIEKFNKGKRIFEKIHSTDSFDRVRLHQCAAFDDKIFIFGNEYGSKTPYPVWSYNPSTNESIAEEQLLLEQQKNLTVHAVNNRLFVMDDCYVREFDLTNRKWKLLGNRYN